MGIGADSYGLGHTVIGCINHRYGATEIVCDIKFGTVRVNNHAMGVIPNLDMCHDTVSAGVAEMLSSAALAT